MKFIALILAASLGAAQSTTNCSIGLGRWSGSDLWDLTVYNVPLSQRQDINVIATLKNQNMGKGDSITIPTSAGVPQAITITNVDDAPAFPYDKPELVADYVNPSTGNTQVKLQFSIPDIPFNWTTADCGAGNVVWSAGIESWTCDFPCNATGAIGSSSSGTGYKEL